MKSLWKKTLCVTLVLCTFLSACIVGAADSDQTSSSTVTNQNSATISPRWSDVALDTNITSYGANWIQPDDFPSFRVWVDNTTGALMTVTITFPSGQTKNMYITSGSNQTYTNNDADPGVYRLSFHTYASTLSGTVRVRVSNVPL